MDREREKLICIQPQKLTFRYEMGKQNSCAIRLSNNSGDHVAFKVMTTNPEKYCVRPKSGVLFPRSNCDVKVTMRAPEEAFSNVQCKDRFLIKTVVASPGDTAESSRKLFTEEGRVVESCKLRVVYESPSHQQSSSFERSRAGSSLNASNLEQNNMNNTERQDINGRQAGGDLFIKGIAIVLLCLIFGYLIMKMLPLIWSLSVMMMMLVIKMARKLVSDSVEDWIVKTLLYLSIHFISLLFRRSESRPADES